MKAMILAAGKGTRMGHLTKQTPKPLLCVEDRALIEHNIIALVNAGITDIVINVHYYQDKIKQALGDGTRYGASIQYSEEKQLLAVGGGIKRALPFFGQQPFVALNADVWTDFSFDQLVLPDNSLGHLVLARNPAHHLEGDFALEAGRVVVAGDKKYTYTGIAIYHPDFFADCQAEPFALRPLLLKHISKKTLTGECYAGLWQDIGTPERLKEVKPKG